MLDLTTAFGNKKYEIKLLDGTVLKLKRPTQALQQTMMKVAPLLKEDKEKLFSVFSDVFCRILNMNDEGIVFEQKQLEDEYDFSIIAYVIQDYFLYWTKEITDNVDFQ